MSDNCSKPLVSVIIPAYNHEKFIGAALDSVLAQTMDDFELIVIDDGSTDSTGKIVRDYSDPRLSYYYQENQDAYNTINRGLGMAGGRYLSILNSDDVYTRNRLEKLVQFMSETDSQAVFTDVIPISDDGVVFDDPAFGWNIWHKKNRDFYFEAGDIYTAFLKGNFMVTTSNLFMRSEAVKKTGRFCSLRYLHDYDYIFRLMLACPGQVHYLAHEKLLYYRIHPGNTLGEAAVIGREQDQELIARYMLEKVPDDLKNIVRAGSERLVELEKELCDVRASLATTEHPGVKSAIKQLFKSIVRCAGKKVLRQS